MEQAVADDGIGGLNRRWYWRIEQTMVLEDWTDDGIGGLKVLQTNLCVY